MTHLELSNLVKEIFQVFNCENIEENLFNHREELITYMQGEFKALTLRVGAHYTYPEQSIYFLVLDLDKNKNIKNTVFQAVFSIKVKSKALNGIIKTIKDILNEYEIEG